MLASTALLLASCADDKFTGEGGGNGLTGGTAPIAFNMQGVGQTRASQTGATAAKALHYEFIVWGEKNEKTGDNENAATEEANTVFKNYKVEYTSGSENTSTTNTKGWEYVGKTPYAESVVSPSLLPTTGTFVQTVKYWDDQASSYTFTAVSAAQSDLKTDNNGPKVKITKNIGSTGEGASSITPVNKGYTIELKSGANVDSIYFSDRNNIAKSSGYSHEAVKMTFRNFMSKIRFGIYETVPGYKVVITGIKYSEGSNNVVTHPTTGDTSDKTFGITGNFVVVGKGSGEGAKNTTYTVTYESDGKAKVEVGTGYNTATYVNTTGTNWLSTSWTSTTGTNNVIAESNSQPTYDRGTNNAGEYTTILPNPSNSTGLTLEISYDLYSEDTGEKISVDYKKAVVPAAYCKWKSNYAYTYIFKISDKSAELYPITFDAVVETDEIGNQETITTVSEPSITTFATTSDGKTIITGKDEYESGNVIYASVVDGSSATTNLSVGETGNIKLYTVTSTDLTNYPITEASVAQALSSTAASTGKKITATAVTISAENSNDTDIKAQLVSKVPGEDGVDRNLSALKWTAENTDATNPKYYAVEYTKTTTENGTSVTKKYYKIVKIAKGGN